jgi:hypothetical protein
MTGVWWWLRGSPPSVIVRDVRVSSPAPACFSARLQEGRLTADIVKIVFFANMARKLFVGGLPYRTTGDELKDAFSKAGEVASASIVTERETGRSRGFGFVEMVNDADADAHRQRSSSEGCVITHSPIANPAPVAGFCFTIGGV